MSKKLSIFICTAALIAPLAIAPTQSINTVYATETDSQTESQNMAPYRVRWYVNTDVNQYEALGIMTFGKIGSQAESNRLMPTLPDGFELQKEPDDFTVKPLTNDMQTAKGYIKRIYSVKPNKAKNKTLNIQYYDGSDLIKTQTIKGYQGQTVPVKFALPQNYNFKSLSNEGMYIAFPGSNYTFASDNPNYKVQITPIDKNEKGKITIHYLDSKNDKELNTQVLTGEVGSNMELSYMYPTIDIDKASLRNQDKPYLKIVGKDDQSDDYLRTSVGKVHLTDKNQDIYVWVSPNGKKVKETSKSKNGAIPMMPTKKAKQNEKTSEKKANTEASSKNRNSKSKNDKSDADSNSSNANTNAKGSDSKASGNQKQNSKLAQNKQTANKKQNKQIANKKPSQHQQRQTAFNRMNSQKRLPQTSSINLPTSILGIAILSLASLLAKFKFTKKEDHQ